MCDWYPPDCLLWPVDYLSSVLPQWEGDDDQEAHIKHSRANPVNTHSLSREGWLCMWGKRRWVWQVFISVKMWLILDVCQGVCVVVSQHWSQSSFTAGSDSCHISCLLRSYHILLSHSDFTPPTHTVKLRYCLLWSPDCLMSDARQTILIIRWDATHARLEHKSWCAELSDENWFICSVGVSAVYHYALSLLSKDPRLQC